MTKTTCTERIDEGFETHTFGINDKKGREFGAKIFFAVQVVEEVPADHVGGYWAHLEAGTYFCWRPQATRGGVSYGPVQRTYFCKTEEERIAQIGKYTKGAIARASKAAK